ncbi:hypothetical protein [Nocardia arizonensis]|uniref:hypothetical protein n=1 Tax=Nocardia arizonensis TaxID=1141647 RepID=UPI0006D12090|nr:hypothetical protein [Nocardia arizonensis]
MMRAAFGALAVTGLILTAPPAFAALGSVVVNGSVHRDPDGCFDVGGSPAQLAVENHTDTTIMIFAWPGCRGEMTVVLTPTQSATVSGSSVQIG